VDHIAGTAGTGALVFAGTDVDDLLVLTVLFLQARTRGRPRPWQIWVGQYLGIGALIAVSAAAALGLSLVPDQWVRLLGLLPLSLGVWGLVRAIRARGGDEEPAPVATGVLPVAGITIANGADNISVYTPLFRTVGPAAMTVMIVVFAALVALWCLVAWWLGSHRRVVEVVDRFGHWIVPLVFIALGVVILVG
jgi:cadmium resistance transport/sequestration family protein